MSPLRKGTRFSIDPGLKLRIRHLLALLVVAGAFSASGCKSNDEMDSSRAWNRPYSWETGLPAALTEGR